jgi:hypothetical protein
MRDVKWSGLKTFQDRVQRRIFRTERWEAARKLYQLHNGQFHNLNCSQIIITLYQIKEGRPSREFITNCIHTKLHGLSPRANYTDRATAACRWSDYQLLRIEGATWSAWRIPTAVFSVLYTGAATFLSSSSSVVPTRLSGPRSRPTTFFSGSAGNRTQASGSVAKNCDH